MIRFRAATQPWWTPYAVANRSKRPPSAQTLLMVSLYKSWRMLIYLEGTIIPWRRESEGISVKRIESGLKISRGYIKLPVGLGI